PLSLFAILFVTFGFRSVLNVFLDSSLSQTLLWVLIGYGMVMVLLWLDRRIDRIRSIRWLRYARYAILAVSSAVLLALVFEGARMVIGSRQWDTLTVRNLGVSGIGTAPAIIALTLYSLLPLVRNTYTGL